MRLAKAWLLRAVRLESSGREASYAGGFRKVVIGKGAVIAIAVAVIAACTVLVRLYDYWQETSFEAAYETVVPGQPGRIRAARPGPQFPALNEYYPLESKQRREEGSVIVRVCVDADGDLTGDPAVAQTSGVERLDHAALRAARAASGRYQPATVDGKPVKSCTKFRIRFKLPDSSGTDAKPRGDPP
jgi:TonB family protein